VPDKTKSRRKPRAGEKAAPVLKDKFAMQDRPAMDDKSATDDKSAAVERTAAVERAAIVERAASNEPSAIVERAAVVERIIAGLIDGLPLRALCREERMPPFGIVQGWIEADPALAARVARARDQGFDAIAEDALLLADRPAETSVEVQQRRLAVETRLKLLAKWCPKRFGDKADPELAAPLDSIVIHLTEERRRELMERRRKALGERSGDRSEEAETSNGEEKTSNTQHPTSNIQ
jgi:hypothetical protein